MKVDYYFGGGFQEYFFDIAGIVLFLCAWPLKHEIESNSDGLMIIFKTETDTYRYFKKLFLITAFN